MQSWVYPHRHANRSKAKKWVVQLLRPDATRSEFLHASSEAEAERLRQEAHNAAAA